MSNPFEAMGAREHFRKTEAEAIAKDREELKAARAELATLRLIVTEKFAGADMYVKPEDAADVAKWASNAQHVRELLKRAEYHQADEEGGNSPCVECGSDSYSAHFGPCLVAAAWRALGDPRGAEDIERAHEEALASNRRRPARAWMDGDQPVAIGEIREGQAVLVVPRPAGVFRLASESQAAAQARIDGQNYFPTGESQAALERARARASQAAQVRAVIGLNGELVEVPRNGRPPAGFSLWASRHQGGWPYVEEDAITASRRASDARGMEAVEDEARQLNEPGHRLRTRTATR